MSARMRFAGDWEVSPPARGTLWRSARARKPLKKEEIQVLPDLFASMSAGRARERKAARGVAPMAARSLRPRARQRWPTDSGGWRSRRKCRFSRVKSVVTSTSESSGGRRMAQSSPIPRGRVLLREAAKSWRICSISASSPIGLRDFFIL